MKRMLPFPLIAVALVAMWILLTESIAIGSILLGSALSIAAARTLVASGLPSGRLPPVSAVFKLLGVVLIEIIRSNNAVARIILGHSTRKRTSGFVRIPLDIRNPYGLAMLSCIITATPGTLLVEYNSADNSILLHVLDLVDENVWVQIIKQRYENRLMEIFG